ncbi:MAG: hypothetical protein IT200_08000 [Thermoleophilia bacterium]|nr:hypothetical protein [Thermoleophilia bacterium]
MPMLLTPPECTIQITDRLAWTGDGPRPARAMTAGLAVPGTMRPLAATRTRGTRALRLVPPPERMAPPARPGPRHRRQSLTLPQRGLRHIEDWARLHAA